MAAILQIDPSKLAKHGIAAPHRDRNGALRLMLDGVEVLVQQDHGMLVLNPIVGSGDGLNAEFSRTTQKLCTAVSWSETITDYNHIKMVETGEYVHGRFRATVHCRRETNGAMSGKLFIEASAPSMSLIRRFGRLLLAGKLTPKHSFGKLPDTAPSQSAEA